jgi:DNA-binding response OmpR family regulator
MKLLLVEDNRQLAEQLTDTLAEHHYVVDVARDGEEGWDLAQAIPYDLLMLDVSLPRLDGVSLCRRLRSNGSQTPILMLTAHDSCADKVMGLDAGADDYLAKPILLNELTARLRALLRRNVRELTPLLEKGKLCLDPVAMQVTYGGKLVKLSPKEYLMLELFLRNSQRIYSRKAILDQLWGLDAELPGEDTVKAHIKGLRNRLKVFGVKDLIQSVYGVGYRLNPDYQEEDSPPQPETLEPVLLEPVFAAPLTVPLEVLATRSQPLVHLPKLMTLPWGDDRALSVMATAWQLQSLSVEASLWLQELEQESPDLLLLDLQEQPQKALALCNTLRQHRRWQGLPIVCLYPANDVELAQQALAAGVDDALIRDLEPQRMLLHLKSRLARVQQLTQAMGTPAIQHPPVQQHPSAPLRP